MARELRKESRPAQMPVEQVRRSSRIEQRKRQAEAGKDKVADYETRRPSGLVDQHQNASGPIKREAEIEQQGPKDPAERAKARKVRCSGSSHKQAGKKETAKEAKARTEKRLKQAQKFTDPLREEQQLAEEDHGDRPATGKRSSRVANLCWPMPADEVTERPPCAYLSRAALRQLQNETVNDPLPEDLQQYKAALSDNSMDRSASRASESADKDKVSTVYDEAFIDELQERGVLDQRFESDGFHLEKPSNYFQIRDAISKDRPIDRPTEADFRRYTKAVWSAGNEAEQGMPYALFFDNIESIEDPHFRKKVKRWKEHKPIVGELDIKHCKPVPKPDLAEGLRALEVPTWIRGRLSGYAVPCARCAFPNYLVELKRDVSMFIAHVQNRHCGAVASQAFVEYFVQLHEKPEVAWNVARVGSIEFNGDVVVGNIHWVSSSDASGKDRTVRKYHMTRVMCHFTYGLSYEDFILARNEARNFREYFEAGRETFLKECNELRQPPNEVPILVSKTDEEDSDDDCTVTGQRAASQRRNTRPQRGTSSRSRQRRDENHAATEDDDWEPKKVHRGRKKKNG